MRLLRSLIFLLLTASGTAAAQTSLPVRFLQDSSHNTRIGIFDHNRVTYGSLDDLARVFTLDTYIDTEAQRFELRTDGYTVKVTADNPFVIVTDVQKNSNVVQLPMNVRFVSRTFFAPL